MIAPLILVFSIVIFGTFWILYRNNPPKLLDSVLNGHGQFYPTAIHQLFSGLYCMELCLGGLFFLVRDSNGKPVCTGQAVTMMFIAFFTLIFHCIMDYGGRPSWRSIFIKPGGDAFRRREQEKRQNRLGKDGRHLMKGKSDSATSSCIIWVPRDSLGIAANESYHARKYNKRLVFNSKGTVIDRDGRIDLSSGPLDQVL